MTDQSAPGVQSVHRALDVLEAVTRSGPLGVNQIAQAVDLSPSTAHGLIRTLTVRGYLSRVPTGYAVGPAALGLTVGHDRAADLSLHLEPLLTELTARTQLATTATMLVGREARIVASTPSPGAIAMHVTGHGWKDPLELATGWVLVALGDPGLWGGVIARTQQAPRLYPSWREVFAQVRRAGVAFRPNRDPRGAISIALPVLGHGGEAVCAIGLFAPAYLALDVMNHTTLDALWATCAQASTLFGGVLPRPPDPDFTALRRHLPDELLRADELEPPRTTLAKETTR